MTFKEFSRKLITSQDLDPDYVYIRAIGEKKNLNMYDLVRWSIHKIFIYDTASEYLVQFRGKDVENMVHGSERQKAKRHTKRYLTEFLSKFRLCDLPREYTEARKFLKEFPGVGDWAAWKFCDLMERVCDIDMDFRKVDFRTAYDYPLRGLCRVNGQPDEYVRELRNDEIYQDFMLRTQLQLGEVTQLFAPPLRVFNRRINIQEIETCLCKYHSYLSGHYKIGKDTTHLNHRFVKEHIEIPVDLTKLHSNPLSL